MIGRKGLSEKNLQVNNLFSNNIVIFAVMIAVTGGSGLVGAHLLLNLLLKGEKVKALIRKNSSMDFVKKVFSRHFSNFDDIYSQITWIEGDILDIFSLEELFADVSEVYHTAALVSFESKDKDLLFKTNIEGTSNIVNLLLEKGNVKLCHVSSIGALGRVSDNEKYITEDTHFSTSINHSAYSISKYEAEREVWRGIEEGLNAVIVNPSIILGPGHWDKGSAKLFKTVYEGLKYYTAGTNGFVNVNDLVEIMVLLTKSNISSEQFIISAENVSYRQLFTWMAEAFNVPVPEKEAGKVLSAIVWRILKLKGIITGGKSSITRETARTAQQIYLYDNTKLLNSIDFKYTPVKETVKRTVEIFLKETTVH